MTTSLRSTRVKQPLTRPSADLSPLRRERLFVVLAAAALLSACTCTPPRPPPDSGAPDAGEVDAGFDAGQPVEDAGLPDAGPPPELRIRRLLPPRGSSSGGTPVLFEGSGFLRDFAPSGSQAKRVTAIRFGSNPVIDFQIIDDETLEVRTPPGAAGPVSVSMTNPNGSFVCNNCFTYFDELTVTSVAPREGPLAGGNELVLSGQGFTADVQVLFGNRSAPSITLVDSKQLRVTVPAGEVAGLVDLTVYNKNGVANLRRHYRYRADLRVSAVAPLTGPLAGGTTVTLTGAGFTGATAVRFGSAAAASFTVVSDTQLTATTPAATGAGAVDVSVTTPFDAWTVKNGFTYVDAAGAFALFGVFPHVVSPGQVVTLTGQALDTAGLAVALGGQGATVGAVTFSTAQVTVPARAGAPRKSDVVATDGTATRTLAQGATWRLGVTGISPSTGPSTGGTAATVTGTALPADAQVFLGALSGTAATVTGETSVAFTTPKGSGGAPSDVRVREGADPENEATLAGAFTFLEPLSVGRVQPERGAIAGNTLVTVLGAGFGDSTVVAFGANRAKDVKVVDSHTLTCRTPRGDVGTVDVKVERLTETDTLPGGFSYFDPRSISGGLSGGPLVGTLNVTVLDSTPGLYGAPVDQATVMLGIDAATPYQGLTDRRGQITFSDPSLVKAQVVTVYKENYESTTVTAVNAENLTVFISRTGGGEGSPGAPPPGPPPSTISGRVTGFKPPRILTANETLEARVFVTQTSLYGGPPFRGPPNKSSEKWRVLVDGGEYLVFTGAGLRAVYAVLGIANRTANTFVPFAMGVRRGITTSPDNPAIAQDIVLDMHLDLNVPITIDGPLSFPGEFGPEPATNRVYAWLDLGAEGFIPNPDNWDTGLAAQSSVQSAGTSMTFPHFPQLDGSNFIFLNEASGAQSYPVSYYFRRQPGDMSLGVTIGPLLPAADITAPLTGFSGTVSWNIDPGPTPNLYNVQILKPTLFGTISLWNMVLPGTETQVVLPPPAVTKLRNEEAGNQLFVVIYGSRSPKFSYNQWTYDTLSGVNWSSFTISLSPAFTP